MNHSIQNHLPKNLSFIVNPIKWYLVRNMPLVLTDMHTKGKFDYLVNIPIFLFSVISFIFLMGIASYNRLFADDYCYLLQLRSRGLFNSIIDSYQYLNGRWLSHLINFLLYSTNEFFLRAAPLLFPFLAIAIGFILYPVFRKSREKIFSLISISFFLTLLVILISPEFFLTTIWTLHVAILVGGLTCTLMASGLFIRLMVKEIPNQVQWKFMLLILALLSTSFHEGIALLALYLYMSFFLLEIKAGKISKLPTATYLIVGAILGIVSVFLASSNINRAVILGSSPEISKFFTSIGLLLLKYIFFLAGEYLADWRGLAIPLLSLFSGLVFSRLSRPFQTFMPNHSFRKLAPFIFSLPFLLSFMVILPFTFVSGYFPLRTFFVIGFILTLGNFVLGLWIGQFEWTKKISPKVIYAIWLCTFLFTSISSTLRLNNYLYQIKEYAKEFDARETLIQNAVNQKLDYVKVPKFNHLLDVEWVSDIDNKEVDCNLKNSDTYPIKLLLTENPPNCCFSRYYGITLFLEGSYR
ncbi:hypothetical protein BECAL_03136 [Bellilinea caldifistulae]|uniref:Glycosyltransferase RgtA/B/C/D-like domain-containing protein n=1 Tax=Bellilinea caldifistulae TaxID=360411 RepID=A0A0P6Y3T7_9CHLR|nr:hypothetical protein [Bellilinea caldifistulae]KPL76272.1 hypothetical protein AC812_06230 [Bellilinea caldifistulae]GAP11937.1 hypothetical protein BECAL_03136 [Bellilinea caldifistulae]